MQGPRAQADRKLYRQAMQAAIRATPNLEVIEAAVEDLIVENGAAAGIVTADGREIRAGAVVLTTGTFLRGLIHIGEEKIPAGRIGEAPAHRLSRALYWPRLAPRPAQDRHAARLDGRTIDWARCEMQPGDDPPDSFLLPHRAYRPRRRSPAASPHHGGDARHHPRQPARSPMYSGQIESVGPRYCPSIEDKVVRFAGARPGIRSSWSLRA